MAPPFLGVTSSRTGDDGVHRCEGGSQQGRWMAIRGVLNTLQVASAFCVRTSADALNRVHTRRHALAVQNSEDLPVTHGGCHAYTQDVPDIRGRAVRLRFQLVRSRR